MPPGTGRPGTGQPGPPLVRDYLRLGLALGRHLDGLVDCWFGDPELAAAVAAEPLVPPDGLAREAARLLAAVPDSGLPAPRAEFLAAQLTALRCTADRLAGAQVPFLEEISTCFGVHVALGDRGEYAAAHDELRALLPGGGDLAGRLESFRERNQVPPDRLLAAVEAVTAALRELAGPALGLPAGERVELDTVTGTPWHAFNRYLGDLRSRVTLNTAAGADLAALPMLAAHEAYPGHHAEHCLKEAGLVREAGWQEHAISLVNTPQCVLAEGAAEAGLGALVGPGWGRWTQDVLAGLGLHLDGELTEAVHGQLTRLFPARQDAAVLLHDRGAGPDEVAAHLRGWLLIPDGQARHMLAFLTDPLWRAYTSTYIEGARLARGWLAAGPQPPVARLRRLLREPLLPAQLAAELAAAPA